MKAKDYKIAKEKFVFYNQDKELHDEKLKTKPIGYFKDAMYRFTRNKASITAAFIIMLLFLFAILGPIITPYQVKYNDTYYRFVLPKSKLAEYFNWNFWDGCQERTLSRESLLLYKGIGEETNRLVIKNNKYEEITKTQLNQTQTYYTFRLDTYNQVGVVFMNLNDEEYQAIQRYQDEKGIQVIYPITNQYLRPQTPQDKNEANYWYKTSGKSKTKIELDSDGNFVNIYLQSGYYTSDKDHLISGIYYNSSNQPIDRYGYLIEYEEDELGYAVIKNGKLYNYDDADATLQNLTHYSIKSLYLTKDHTIDLLSKDLVYLDNGSVKIGNTFINFVELSDGYLVKVNNRYELYDELNVEHQNLPRYHISNGIRLLNDNYTSKMRIEDASKPYEYYQYGERNQTGWLVRVSYYDYYVYLHTEVLKDGITKPYFIFGTTNFGQDIFTCLSSGARFSFILAIIVASINLLIGALYGAIEGYYGGKIDIFMERIVELLNAIPFMIVIAILKHNFDHVSHILLLFLAFFITGWTGMAARTRMQFYRFKNQEYVLASRTLGASDYRVMFKHIFPNAIGTLITGSVLVIPSVIFSETTLSYLGIINLSTGNLTSVGTLLATGQNYLFTYPHMIVFPAIFISLLMLSFNLFGNGLRDAFNPSLRGVEE